MASDIAVGAVVQGVVQGVGFRYSTRQAADRLCLTGWVRNRADGSVEVLVQGPAAPVDKLIQFLREGPTYSRVTSVDVIEKDADPQLTGFEILL